MAKASPTVSIIPLGGLGEIGKNMTAYRAGDDILVVDAGVMFPEEEMLGVDLVIPDITYLVENREKVRAIVLTHGHEDHIGALPYVLRQLQVPVYGTRLTLGLVRAKLAEHNLGFEPQLLEVKAGDRITVGRFGVEFIHVNHSIADVVVLAIETPAGVIVHATDFKFDQTPIDGRVADIQRLAALGGQGVLALLSDSTNAERPGYTLSERVVGEALREAMRKAEGRILVASFASNVHRIQQVVTAAQELGRKVAVLGRSMENVVSIARELGYLQIAEDTLIGLDEVDDYPPQDLVVLTTGSQGEPMSALSRMAMADHRRMEILPGDTVIISALPIPGNERMVGRIVDHLFRLGANVIYEAVSGVHVSGHANQEELKLMLNLVRPRFFIPIHGEYRMLVRHASLARQVGIPDSNILIADNGDVIECTSDRMARVGRVQAGMVFVDGLGVGDVGNVVLRDRRQLAQDGILVVVATIHRQTNTLLAGPELVTRGFVYVREAEALLEEARQEVQKALLAALPALDSERGPVKAEIRELLSRFFYERIKRRPMIVPILLEV